MQNVFGFFHRTYLLKKFFNFLKKNRTYNSSFFLEYNIILFMKIFGDVKYYKLPWSFRYKDSRNWPLLQNFCSLNNFKIKFKKNLIFYQKIIVNIIILNLILKKHSIDFM